MDDRSDEDRAGLVEQYRRAMPADIAELREERAGFEGRLRARWGAAFDKYDLAALALYQAGKSFHERHRARVLEANDLVFDALVKLHARGCLTISEVRALLLSGHPAGARARWRTLHELAVTAHLIRKQGRDVAERYLQHGKVAAAKAANQWQGVAREHGIAPLDADTVGRLQAESAALIAHYGKSFKGDYGWAAAALGFAPDHERGPDFARIERAVELQAARPAYRQASQHVHAGPAGLAANNLLVGGTTIMVTGPRLDGLAMPGALTLDALLQCTTALLDIGPPYTDDNARALLRALHHLVEDAGETFGAIEDILAGEVERARPGTQARQEEERPR